MAAKTSLRDAINFALLAIFIGLIFLMGGASRADALSQIPVRLLSIVALAVWAFQLRRDEFARLGAPVAFLIAIAALIALQLVPLPPEMWTGLPGRQPFVDGLALAGMEPGWRPATLTPDRTLNSLLAVLPALAVGAGLALVSRERQQWLVLVLLGFILLSAFIGMIQAATGQFYFYRVTSEDAAVGLFANRNHQAVLIACALPLMAFWSTAAHGERIPRTVRTWLALVVATFLVPLLLITGSRGGILLGVLSAVLSLIIARAHAPAQAGARTWRGRLLFILPVLLGAAALAASFLTAREKAFSRLTQTEGEEIRFQNLDMYLRIAGDFFPAGSGFGSFDPVYRLYEPHEALATAYLNHAHNDPIQVVMEGGLPGLILMLLFALWFLWTTWRLWRPGAERSSGRALGRAGFVIALLILLSSAVDYPLRTPTMSMLMVVALAWMALGARATAATASSRSRSGRSPTDKSQLGNEGGVGYDIEGAGRPSRSTR